MLRLIRLRVVFTMFFPSDGRGDTRTVESFPESPKRQPHPGWTDLADPALAPYGSINMSLSVFVERHIEWLERFRIPGFILVATGYLFVLKLLLAMIVAIFWYGFIENNGSTVNADVTEGMEEGYLETFVTVAIAAPLFETFVGQWIPVRLASLVTSRIAVMVFLSLCVFAGMHILPAPLSMTDWVVGISCGFVFALSFVHWKRLSYWRAYWVTAIVHGFHNAVVSMIRFL